VVSSPLKSRLKASFDALKSPNAPAPAVGSTAGACCWGADGLEVGVGFEVGAFPPAGALAPFANEAWLTGVIGVEGVGVAGGSASDVEGAFAVEFFLFGRYR
jgi:hypothetical protein